MGAGVGFDSMDHGVNCGSRGMHRRQTERQVGIQQHHIAIQLRGHHAHFAVFTGGENRDVGYFGAGSGGRRDLHQRQTRPFDLIHAVHRVERLLRRREHGGHFRHIQRGAAADPNDHIAACLTGLFRRAHGQIGGRVGDDPVESG